MKPTVGNRVLQANKALLEDGLKAILIQEVVRMLQKSNTDIPEETMTEILSKFSQK